jgi:hypothetical protein
MASVKAMKLTMLDEFEIKGFWWLPEIEEEVSGILFYKKDKIHLELLGTLNNGESKIFPSFGKYGVILGRSDTGEEFTLFDAFTINSNASFPGYVTESITINSFIVGGHLEKKDANTFHSCTINLTYLTKWRNRPIFKSSTMFEKDSSHISGSKLEYFPPDELMFDCYIPSIKARIKEDYITNFSGDISEKVVWTHKTGLKIISDELESFDWYIQNINLLKNLATLFIGYSMYYEKIIFYGSEQNVDNSTKTFRKKYMYFYRQIKTKIKNKFDWSDSIIQFSEIESKLPAILNLWFEKHRNLEIVYELYFASFYRDKHINTTLLNAIQTLEIYHRKSFEGKLFDKKTYRTYAKLIKVYANSTFPEAFAKKISDMMAFGNEFSLYNRLLELISVFEEETRIKLIGNEDEINKFIRQLVDTRNYLTHFDVSKKKNLIEGNEEKYFAMQRLLAITAMLLFKEIGIEESVIREKIMESKHFSFSLAKAKEILS